MLRHQNEAWQRYQKNYQYDARDMLQTQSGILFSPQGASRKRTAAGLPNPGDYISEEATFFCSRPGVHRRLRG